MKTISDINAELIKEGKSPFKHWAIFSIVVITIGWLFMQIPDKSGGGSFTSAVPSKEDAKRDMEDAARDARLYAISFGQMALEETLRDPGSVDYDLKAVNLDNGALCYAYRAKNGFNGMSFGYAVIVNGVSHTTAKAFKKHCSNGANYERY